MTGRVIFGYHWLCQCGETVDVFQKKHEQSPWHTFDSATQPPDAVVCATDVPEGRPAPWMCLENARQLGVYPMESIVKVDDTVPGIEEGLNAGMWTIGTARTGNEIGLSEEEVEALPVEEYRRRIERAYHRLGQSEAHYVVDSITDVPACLDEIHRRLRNGEKP